MNLVLVFETTIYTSILFREVYLLLLHFTLFYCYSNELLRVASSRVKVNNNTSYIITDSTMHYYLISLWLIGES
jgi:hypothetical protein